MAFSIEDYEKATGAKVVFAYAENEKDTGEATCLIVPMERLDDKASGLSNDQKRSLIRMRDTLKTVFEVAGMGFDTEDLRNYPKLQGGIYNKITGEN